MCVCVCMYAYTCVRAGLRSFRTYTAYSAFESAVIYNVSTVWLRQTTFQHFIMVTSAIVIIRLNGRTWENARRISCKLKIYYQLKCLQRKKDERADIQRLWTEWEMCACVFVCVRETKREIGDNTLSKTFEPWRFVLLLLYIFSQCKVLKR